MPPEISTTRCPPPPFRWAAVLTLAAGVFAGCATGEGAGSSQGPGARAGSPALQPPASTAPEAASAASAPPPAAPAALQTPPPPAAPAPVAAAAPPSPVEALLAHADALRSMSPAELAQEVANVADPSDTAPRMMRLALALHLARTPINNIRAQVLLQRVLAQNGPEARALHPLARLLAQQVAEARRFDEQAERYNQQLREAQRRIEQLNERLEAVRAIERSLPSRPLPAPAAGAPAKP